MWQGAGAIRKDVERWWGVSLFSVQKHQYCTLDMTSITYIPYISFVHDSGALKGFISNQNSIVHNIMRDRASRLLQQQIKVEDGDN